MAKKKRSARQVRTIPAWPLGFAPPGPPTRLIREPPPELEFDDDIPVTTLTELDEILEVVWGDDEEGGL